MLLGAVGGDALHSRMFLVPLSEAQLVRGRGSGLTSAVGGGRAWVTYSEGSVAARSIRRRATSMQADGDVSIQADGLLLPLVSTESTESAAFPASASSSISLKCLVADIPTEQGCRIMIPRPHSKPSVAATSAGTSVFNTSLSGTTPLQGFTGRIAQLPLGSCLDVGEFCHAAEQKNTEEGSREALSGKSGKPGFGKKEKNKKRRTKPEKTSKSDKQRTGEDVADNSEEGHKVNMDYATEAAGLGLGLGVGLGLISGELSSGDEKTNEIGKKKRTSTKRKSDVNFVLNDKTANSDFIGGNANSGSSGSSKTSSGVRSKQPHPPLPADRADVDARLTVGMSMSGIDVQQQEALQKALAKRLSALRSTGYKLNLW